MKKIILLIPIMLICLTGCGAKTGKIECTLETNDVINGYKINSTYNINYKGKTVESVDTIEIVTTDSEEMLDYFETYLKEAYSKVDKAYGGYSYNVDRLDDKIESKVSIDYSKMNIEQFVKDQPTLKSYVENNKLLTEGIKAMYESMGATCK